MLIFFCTKDTKILYNQNGNYLVLFATNQTVPHIKTLLKLRLKLEHICHFKK